MFAYFIKRISLFIPSLIVLSILIFGLSKLSPGDPVQSLIEESRTNDKGFNLEEENEIIKSLEHELGLDLPEFYFSLNRRTHIDNYIKIQNPIIRANFNQLAYNYGSGELATAYYNSIKMDLKCNSLLYKLKKVEIDSIILDHNSIVLTQAWKDLSNNNSIILNYIPSFHWHGTKNQYHNWISGFIVGDFGYSYFDRKPIKQKIKNALPWTITLSLIAIILALLIAIPTGVYAAVNEGSIADIILNKSFFAIYSIPNFWLASLFVVYFTNPEHFNWFPSYGLGEINSGDSFFQILGIRIQHLTLPVIVWTYGSIAFVFRQTRSSMIKQLKSDYIQTAKAKGLSLNSIVWRHAFKNASFPLITIIGSAVPAVFSGSFVVEYIFSIPGMGMLTIQSFTSRDYPVIFSVLMLMGVLTIIGLLIADILYAWNDPRVKLITDKS